jgi:protein TonB
MKQAHHYLIMEPSTRIARFALLSLAAHLALLATGVQPALLLGQHDNVLSVSLVDAPAVPAPAKNAPITSRAHHAPVLPSDYFSQTSIDSGTLPIKNEPGSHEPAAEAVAPSDSGGKSQEPVRARILARLRAELARHFDYPALARSRGWEGTVLLKIQIEPDGRLEKIQISHSSGYAVLDDSAINSLSRVDQLADASSWLNGRGLDIQLPVIYRLIEN